jgi:hypothetical protein
MEISRIDRKLEADFLPRQSADGSEKPRNTEGMIPMRTIFQLLCCVVVSYVMWAPPIA